MHGGCYRLAVDNPADRSIAQRENRTVAAQERSADDISAEIEVESLGHGMGSPTSTTCPSGSWNRRTRWPQA